MEPPPDKIIISQLGVSAFIGVTAEERRRPQRLRVSCFMEPKEPLVDLGDEIERTVDYHEVCCAIKSLAVEGERHLIETLASDIAKMLLERFAIRAVEIELRKYILPDTEFVAVRIYREAAG